MPFAYQRIDRIEIQISMKEDSPWNNSGMRIMLPRQQRLGAHSFHCVRLAGSGLSVGEHGAVVAMEDFTDERLDYVSVNVDLRRIFPESSVERERFLVMTLDGDAFP